MSGDLMVLGDKDMFGNMLVVLRFRSCWIGLYPRTAARLLAGLQVRLSDALRDLGSGKCLKCGKVWQMWWKPGLRLSVFCLDCGGVLEPMSVPDEKQ